MTRRSWLIVLGLCLALPTLGAGFLTDDHRFRALASHPEPGAASWMPDLFAFASGSVSANTASIAAGQLPWWTAPDFRLHLWRPLTGALFAAQYRLFGDHAWGYHAVSLGLFALLLVLVLRLYRTLLPGAAGVWALAVFAVRGVHPDAYGWIAAQHVLIGAVFVVYALLAKVAPRTDDRRDWVVPGRLALGLLASESALCGVLFVLCFEANRELAAWRGAARGPHDARLAIGNFFRATWRVWLLMGVYCAIYRALGLGSRSGGFYRDPFGSPLAFWHVAPTRVLVLLADALGAVPSELGNTPRALWAAGAGAIAVAVVACLWWFNRDRLTDAERRALHWLVPGAGIGLIVASAGLPGGRVLTLPDVGFAALVGVLLRVAVARRGLQWIVVAGLGAVQLVLAPLDSLVGQRRMVERARASERIGRALLTDIGNTQTAFLFASDPVVFAASSSVALDEAPDFRACLSLASAVRGPNRLSRTGARTLLVEPLNAPMLARGSFETFVRDERHPFAVGARVRQCEADFVVTKVADGKPSAVAIEFARDPADELAFFAWNGHKLERFSLPEIGESRVMPWFAGPQEQL